MCFSKEKTNFAHIKPKNKPIMKRTLIFILLSSLVLSVKGQGLTFDENGETEKVVETSSTAKESYQYIKMYFVKNLPNYKEELIEDDSTRCHYAVRVAHESPQIPYKRSESLDMDQFAKEYATLVFDCKDKRFRIRIENILYDSYLISWMKHDERNVRKELKGPIPNIKYINYYSSCADKKTIENDREKFYGDVINQLSNFITKEINSDNF